jgi:hypothetical protein
MSERRIDVFFYGLFMDFYLASVSAARRLAWFVRRRSAWTKESV